MLVYLAACTPESKNEINLSGQWNFQIDSLNEGVIEQWYQYKLDESVHLPGSMTENEKGNDVSVRTKWTGQIVDSSWFKDDKYVRYRKDGNVKIPFWLQPEKHYVGAAWYQRIVEIPRAWEGKVVELTLERPHWETQVWVDDRYVGMRNSLGTAHVYDLTEYLKAGQHRLSIRVDNSVKEINPGMNSHSISDHTQSNWNGIVGEIALHAGSRVAIKKVKLYPDVSNKEVCVKVQFKNYTCKKQKCELSLEVTGADGQALAAIRKSFEMDGEHEQEIVYPMGDNPLLWDEFNPNLYVMQLRLKSSEGIDEEKVTFGMRNFVVDGTRFAVNNRPVFLRGTLECAIFPKTGYPATDVVEWERIMKVCKSHGLNHMRFHSWCPPEAAFVAADQVGVYLQVECSAWANAGATIGDGKPIDKWLYQEADDILNAYGNHPSFCMMAYGNEPAGKNMTKYLREFVNYVRTEDTRHVYTGGAGWPYIDNLDFYNDASPRIQGWGQSLNSIINSKAPQTQYDFSELIQKIPMPYVSHEIGQWCAYPNFKEIPKYTGVLKAKNFEIFRETLQENRMGGLADSFLLASGKLQALCYKADIEAALRTSGFAGFQLLDLHDFPGQGTALVGVLDAFWEEKGYITPEEYSRFCNETVPLARFAKRTFLSGEMIVVDVEAAHFGSKELQSVIPNWKIMDQDGNVVLKGQLASTNLKWGNGIKLGQINTKISTLKAKQLTLEVEVAGFMNCWDFWVYPSTLPLLNDDILVTQQLDDRALSILKKGGKVLLTPIKGSLKPEKGGRIAVGFSSIFWNTAWTRKQKPHTLGVLCNPEHPALAEFPGEYHSNWQWWDAMSHSNAIKLDEFTPELKPIVRVIDDWFTNRRLALIFEAKVGKGKLMVSGIDFITDKAGRPEAGQLLYSLRKYMNSKQFDPAVEMEVVEISGLFK